MTDHSQFTDESELPDDPQETLKHISSKMERVAQDFSEGLINRAQFNAMYTHYNDKRTIIQRLVERDPDNNSWKQAYAPGHTGFLRAHFEAHPIFYIVFKHHESSPLVMGGDEPEDIRPQIGRILKSLWQFDERPESGVARKAMDDGKWLIIAFGENALTIVVYTLQPSNTQNDQVRDIHAHFERANRLSLMRNISPSKMVFPQRTLFQTM